jgi:hypothetical protein
MQRRICAPKRRKAAKELSKFYVRFEAFKENKCTKIFSSDLPCQY